MDAGVERAGIDVDLRWQLADTTLTQYLIISRHLLKKYWRFGKTRVSVVSCEAD